jgi:hypothetical protein
MDRKQVGKIPHAPDGAGRFAPIPAARLLFIILGPYLCIL